MADDTAHDLLVAARDGTTGGDLAEALGTRLGLEVTALTHRDTGLPVDFSRSIRKQGIHRGSVLLVGPPPPPDGSAPTLELVVSGGLHMGARFPLSAGTRTLGRSEAADIRLQDPLLSRLHMSIDVSATPQGTPTVRVADLDSQNGISVDGERVQEVTLVEGQPIQAGGALFCLRHNGQGQRALAHSFDGDGRTVARRPPRVAEPILPTTIPLPGIPEAPRPRRLPLAAAGVPLLAGFALWVFGRKSGSNVAPALALAFIAPLIAIGSYLESKVGGRGKQRRAVADWVKDLNAGKQAAAEINARMLSGLLRSHPDIELMTQTVRSGEGWWMRRQIDPDFLRLRVGYGDLAVGAKVQLDVPPNSETDPAHLRRYREAADRTAELHEAPVLAELAGGRSIAVIADLSTARRVARWLVCQAAYMSAPSDLAIAVFGSRTSDWQWCSWLPQVEGTVPVPGPHVALSKEAQVRLLDSLEDLVESRLHTRPAGERGPSASILMIADAELDEAITVRVSALAEKGREAGISLIGISPTRREAYRSADHLLEVAGGKELGRAVLTATNSGETVECYVDGTSADRALRLSLALAPYSSPSESAAGTALRPVSLLEALALPEPSPEAIRTRWVESTAEPRKLSVSLGLCQEGPWTVDLVADGPHALVAGTTGAGKSELLQSLVVSLASTYSPSDLSLLLVDYKGGSAFAESSSLPHVSGVLTDLQGHLAQRALVSLRAELRRREQILLESGAKDLASLKDKNPDVCPAALVIVIDEFAALIREVPDFVAGLVDVAQRGRSLGVHLILATQRPAGSVTADMRANTELRICLRVLHASDSLDIVGDEGAASLPKSSPGRALVRSGSEPVRHVQVAYAGARTPHPGAPSQDNVQLRNWESTRLNRDGDSSGHADPAGTDTDMARVVAAVQAAAVDMPSPHPAWLPPLPVTIGLDELLDAPTLLGAHPVLGLADYPDRQLQEPYVVDLDAKHGVLVIGGPASGKSMLLRTLSVAATLADGDAPTELYAIQASNGLADLETLPSCAALIEVGDEERVRRLFAHLQALISARRSQFASSGFADYQAYRRSLQGGPPGTDPVIPRVLFVIDGFGGFAEAYETHDGGRLYRSLPNLLAGAAAVGIHPMFSAERRGIVPNAVANAMMERLVLRQATDDDYLALGLPSQKGGQPVPPGRAWNQEKVQVQVAEVPGLTLKRLAEDLRSTRSWPSNEGIRTLPVRLGPEELGPSRPDLLAFGRFGSDLQTASLDLTDRCFLILGSRRSGKTSIMRALAISSVSCNRTAVVFSPKGTDSWPVLDGLIVCRGQSEIAETLQDGALLGSKVLALVDDAEQFVADKAETSLDAIVQASRQGTWEVVVSGDSKELARSYAGWITEVKKDAYGFVLGNDDPALSAFGAVRGRGKETMHVARGWLADKGEASLVQAATVPAPSGGHGEMSMSGEGETP